MDRRTILGGFAGLVGAGTTYRLAYDQKDGAPAPFKGGVKSTPQVRSTGLPGVKSVTLTQVPIGGGGFVTGLDISSDGSRFVCRTDVANGYVRDAGDAYWRPLFSANTLQSADFDPPLPRNGKADGQGVSGIRIAPSDKDILYAGYLGYLWRSSDGGRSMRRTKMPQAAMPSNAGGQRLFNRTIDIDPANASRVMVGTCGEGVWYTLDGERWEQARLPSASKSRDGLPGIFLVLFDPKVPDRVFAFVTGVGFFRSVNGPGGQFEPVQGGPTVCSNMVAGADGRIHLCEQTAEENGKVWSYDPARAALTSSRPEHEAMLVAVDPRRPNRLIASNPNSYIMESVDSGQSWKSIGGTQWVKGKGEVAWMRGLGGMYPAEMMFDPVTPGKLWFAQGVGVASAGATGTPYQLSDWSAGIEELCAVHAITVPDGKTFLSAWDKSFWRIDDYTTYSNDFRYPVAKGAKHNPGTRGLRFLHGLCW